MKKNTVLLSLLVLTIFFLTNCGPDDPSSALSKTCTDVNALNPKAAGDCVFGSTKQISIFTKFTGTWCFACGDYGSDIVHQMEALYHDDLIILEAHKTDVMTNDIVVAWKDNWPHTSTPSFIANDELMVGHPVAPGKKNINTTNGTAQTASLAAAYKVAGGTVSGTAYLKAASALTGKHSLAIYLVGDNYVASQTGEDGSAHPTWEFKNGSYPNYIHTNTLRGEVNNKAFGTEIFSTSLPKNELKSYEFSYKLPTSVTEDIRVIAVLWNTSGSKPVYVNATRGVVR